VRDVPSKQDFDSSIVAAAVGLLLSVSLFILTVSSSSVDPQPSARVPMPLTGVSQQLPTAEPERESDPMHDDALAQDCGTISVYRGWLLCESGPPIPIIR
jgi:hypothetical protein